MIACSVRPRIYYLWAGCVSRVGSRAPASVWVQSSQSQKHPKLYLECHEIKCKLLHDSYLACKTGWWLIRKWHVPKLKTYLITTFHPNTTVRSSDPPVTLATTLSEKKHNEKKKWSALVNNDRRKNPELRELVPRGSDWNHFRILTGYLHHEKIIERRVDDEVERCCTHTIMS